MAIHEFFRSLPYDYTAIRRTTGTDFNIVRSVVEYRRPLRFDEPFAVEVALGRIGRTILTFTPAIWTRDEADPRATGEVVWVHADQATMRAVPLPAELLEDLRLLPVNAFARLEPWLRLPPSA